MTGFNPQTFAGERFAVLGLGRAGRAAATTLAVLGADVIAWDDSEQARAAAPDLHLQNPLAQPYDALILSPGIPHALPKPHQAAADATARAIPILTDADLLHRAVRASGSRARFVGITGTNGKSTTTALLAHILTQAHIPNAAGANLGTAALALPWLPDDGVYVLEMSSYMLERLASLRFDAAAMLNLTPDHLDRHGDMAGYARAKRHIFDRQTSTDTAILGIDDEPSRAMHATLPAARTISGHHPADIWADGAILRDATGEILDLTTAPTLPGAHNAQNAAAATALALALGLPRATIAASIRTYPGLPHRQQIVARQGALIFVNDSKATNADATARALACYDRVIWIAGGQAKSGGIEPLAPFFPRIAEALLIGRDAAIFAATLAAHAVPHRIVHTLDAAVAAAPDACRRTNTPTILLSPAAASWDQFASFEHRGQRFADLAAATLASLAEAAA